MAAVPRVLTAFILSRCPKEVYPHVPTVISICLRYLTYDPNYNFDDEDEDDNAMDAEQNDEDYQGTETLALAIAAEVRNLQFMLNC